MRRECDSGHGAKLNGPGSVPVGSDRTIYRPQIAESVPARRIRRAGGNFATAAAFAASVFIQVANSQSLPASYTPYYASPGGTGLTCTITDPCSLAQAQTFIRTLNGSMLANIVVFLRGGTYQLSGPLTFLENSTTHDSGSNGFSISWAAFPGETPVFSGGVQITGWSVYDAGRNIYRAKAPAGLNSRSLYVNGLRATRARGWPGFLTKTNTGYTVAPAGSYDITTWQHPEDLELGSMPVWRFIRCGVASFAPGVITMKEPCFSNSQAHHSATDPPTSANPWWIENALELLDLPGEWYLDQHAGWLYYEPRANEDISSAQVLAPIAESLLQVSGEPGTPIHDLQFLGITFEYTNWADTGGPAGYAGIQAGFTWRVDTSPIWWPTFTDPATGNNNNDYQWSKTPGSIVVHYGNSIVLANSIFTHLGKAGLNVEYGSQHTRIVGNLFYDISSSGIQIGDNESVPFQARAGTPSLLTYDTLIRDNLIAQTGAEITEGVGIWAGYVDTLVIDHNEIFSTSYNGISLGWGWGIFDPTLAGNNVISSNDVHDACLQLWDCGTVYMMSAQPGSSIHDNYIHDQPKDHAGSLIYMDYGSQYFTITNNVAARTPDYVSIPNVWLLIWNYVNDSIQGNFTDGTTKITSPGTVIAGNQENLNAWPAQAQQIIAAAGLEPAYQSLNNKLTLQFPVTTYTDPPGLSLTVDGITTATLQEVYCPFCATYWWVLGSTHTVAAPDQTTPSGLRYTFSSWGHGGTAAQTVAVRAGITYAATFQLLPPVLNCPLGNLPTIGNTYTINCTASGGIAPYTWSVSAGALPSWLTLNSATGLITGTPGANGIYGFTVQAMDSNTPSQTGTLSVSLRVGPPLTPTITFGPLSNVLLGVMPFSVAATSSSGLAVTFVSNTLPVCTVSGSTVTIVAAGVCSITASDAGNVNFNPATQVTQIFTVGANPQTIAFGTLSDEPLGIVPFGITATATSGLAVTLNSNTTSVCTVSGESVTLVAPGTCSITATQAGNANYAAAVPVTNTFTVRQGSATTTTLTSSTGSSTFGQPITLKATVSPSVAAGRVTFYDGATVLGTGSLSGGQATLTTSLLASGTHALTAYYLGGGSYLPSLSAAWGQTVAAIPGYGFVSAVILPASFPNAISVATGDFNGDGKMDLAVTDSAASPLGVLLGDGSGGFTNTGNYTAGVNPSTVAVGDFNGDGIADLAVTGPGGQNVSVLLGKGDGTFQTAVSYIAGTSPKFVATGDFNADGRPDLAVADYATGNILVLLGNGDGVFQPAVRYAAGTNPDSIAVGDFNGDGKADLAVSNFGGGNLSVLLGKGDGTFQPSASFATGVNPLSMVAADFNGDGKTDLATANVSGTLSVLLGNGNGTFQPSVNTGITGWDAVVAGDFNGDGKPDLAIASYNGYVILMLGNGDGSFQTGVNYIAGNGLSSLAVGDFNGDGRSDLAVANYGGGNVSILLGSASGQTQAITFAAPAAVTLPASPFVLTATASSGLTVSFASGTTSICTVSGSTVAPLTAGTCSITATQAGNTTYAAATPVTQTFTISAAAGGGGGGGGGAGGGAGPGVIVGTLAASPASVTFNVPAGTTSTQTVTLTYQNVFKLGPSFQANATSTNTNGVTWLTVSPASAVLTLASFDGTTFTYTATVKITADATRFGPGNTLKGTVSFTAIDGLTPQPVASTSVSMTVADAPKLTAAPQALSFTYRLGSTNTPVAQPIAVSSNITGLTFSASASTTSGGAWLAVPTTNAVTPGSVPASVNVANLATGSYAGKVALSSGASSMDVPVTLTILAANAPVIAQGGVVPVYSTLTSIQTGSWISIFGTNLADLTVTWNGDFPTTLGGVSVTVDGKPAFLWYVSPTQINLQAPDDTATGPVNVVVTTSHGNFTATVTLAAASPSFSLLDSTHAAGVILTPGGTGAYGGGAYDLVAPSGNFSFNTRPVKAGEVLELFGVGFGPTNPAVPAGQVFNGQAPTVNPVTVTIGGVRATVTFAGLTAAGLYQINVTVPNAGRGDMALQATVNGVQTQPGPVVTIQ